MAAVDSVEDTDNKADDILDEDEDDDSPKEEIVTAIDIDDNADEPEDIVEYAMPSIFSKHSSDKTYIVRNFSNSFLRTECNIKLESCKTVCKFTYDGINYSGIILKKIDSDNYIFLVELDSKNKKKSEKFLKKIYIPNATLRFAKPLQ